MEKKSPVLLTNKMQQNYLTSMLPCEKIASGGTSKITEKEFLDPSYDGFQPMPTNFA